MRKLATAVLLTTATAMIPRLAQAQNAARQIDVSYTFDTEGDDQFQISNKVFKSAVKEGLLNVSLKKGEMFIYNSRLRAQRGMPENYHRFKTSFDVNFVDADDEAYAGIIFLTKRLGSKSYSVLLSPKGFYRITSDASKPEWDIVHATQTTAFKPGAVNSVEVTVDGPALKLIINGTTVYDGTPLRRYSSVNWSDLYFVNKQKTTVDNFNLTLFPLESSQSVVDALVSTKSGDKMFVSEKGLYAIPYTLNNKQLWTVRANTASPAVEVWPLPAGEVLVEPMFVKAINPDSLFKYGLRDVDKAGFLNSYGNSDVIHRTHENGLEYYSRVYNVSQGTDNALITDTYVIHPNIKDRVIHLQTMDLVSQPAIMKVSHDGILDNLVFLEKDASGKLAPVPTGK